MRGNLHLPSVAALLIAATLPALLPAQTAPAPATVPAAGQPTVIAPIRGVAPPPAPTPAPGGMSLGSSRPPPRLLRLNLPDPALLDGSKLEADKYPEYGMIGEFELPGDEITEPAQNQRVGAQDPKLTEPAAGGTLARIDPNQKGGGGQSKSEQAGAGGQSESEKPGGGGDNPAAAGAKAGSQTPSGNDPNAKAEGIQVGELKIDESVAAAKPIEVTGVPIAIGVGDSAMAIKPVAAAAGVTGTESAGTTQQAGQNTGGNSGNTGGGGNNRGAERGKTMPSGL
jgi:hypothetical protein